MAQYAILDENNNVLNVVEWDGETKWEHPANTTLQLSDGTAQRGGHWNGSSFTPPT